MAYSNIRRFVKPHDSGSGGKGTSIYIGSGLDTNNLYVTNLNAVTVNTDKLNANNIDAINGNFKNLTSEYGAISELEGDTLNYKNGHIGDLTSSSISTNTLQVNDNAKIKSLIADDILSTNIVTDYLTVNKSAHFFELIIDKIRSIQGTQMNTAANCVADYVEAYDSSNHLVNLDANNVAYYRVYWKNTDEDRNISNDWLVLDQALCESFNVQPGVSYDVSNKYYWRKVIATDNGTPKYVNLNTGDVSDTEVHDYNITFSTFTYTDGTNNFTNFNVESQISGEWDDVDTWTVGTTQYGLQLTADMIFLGGTLTFTTDKKTMLNIGVYYDDGSFGYLAADNYKTSYSITTDLEKNILSFIITSAVIDKWEACNWIDLSNTIMDATLAGKSAIPSAGDNICQLGYRYNELQNPTQDDINRASAIIIAAYNTPDSGITPPSYAQYQKITDFNLASHRKSFFDANGCTIIGNFKVDAAGQEIDLDDYITQQAGAATTDIVVKANGGEINYCLLQVDSNDEIHDLNNFPQYIDLQVVNYNNAQSLNVNAAYIDLFGRQLDLLAIMQGQASDTADGIYVQQVTFGGTDRLSIRFNWRGSAGQVITNGTVITFSGQAVVDGTTMNLSKTITLGAVSTVQGTDAELWQLYKEKEFAQVNSSATYSRTLIYKIQHIVGTTGSFIAPTSEKLRIREYNVDGSYTEKILRDIDWANNCWTYHPTDINNWFDLQDSSKPIYILIELVDGNNNVLDSSIVNIQLQPTALFIVDEEMTRSIRGVSDDLNDEVNTRQTQYSAIAQTVTGISSTVAGHTTSINNINSNISQINQTMTGISLSVTNIQTDLGTLETDLQRTGIDIEQGKITLNAENTIIDGNLSIHNADEGLVIYDNATDTPKIAIQGDTLGTLSTSGPVPTVNDVYDTLGTVSSNTCTFDIVNLGQLSQNNKIAVDVNIYRRQIAGTIIGNPTYTYNLYRDNTLVQQLTGATSGIISDPTYYRFTTSQFTIPSDGNYTIGISITMQGGTDGDIFSAGVYVTRWLNTIQKIAKDGALFGTNGRNYSWFGSDQTVLSWGASGSQGSSKIVLDGYGVNYAPRSGGYGEIGSQTTIAYVDSGSYYKASVYDGLICIFNGVQPASGHPFYLWLPDPQSCPGKIYYVKQVGTSKSIRVYAYNPNYDTDPSLPQYIAGAFLKEDCTGTRDTDYKDYVILDGIAYTFISCYYKWLIFYNG